jgi:hypothetical protein
MAFAASQGERWLVPVLALTALAAVAVHAPGHLSLDSSLQVYEARTGQSASWAPPFMSALLRWLGDGGPRATTLFVALCALATYGGFALALASAPRHAPPAPTDAGWPRWLRGAAATVVVLNPIVFLYVGIVWKDVLFAALLSLSMGLMVFAASRGRPWLFLLAGLLLVPTPMVRQHGVLLAPLLVLPCLWGLRGAMAASNRVQQLAPVFAAALLYVLAYAGLQAAVHRTIAGSGAKSTSVGITAIQQYDITGMLAAGADTTGLPRNLQRPVFLAAVRRAYSPERLDGVMADPRVVPNFNSLRPGELQAAWWRMVRTDPAGYLAVKADQYAWLLGLHRLDRCLPVHVGIEGQQEYLAAAGFATRRDGRDNALLSLSMASRHLALYRHWFYVVLFTACVVAAWRLRRRFDRDEAGAVLASIAAIAVLYASFGPTVLACDFRYLYPGIVMVSVLALFLLSRRWPAAPAPTPPSGSATP